MFTHLYYLRVVIYCSCYFFSWGGRGGGRNFDVFLTGKPQQTTRIDFHNTQHEGTPFCWLLWHSLNSLWWYIWSGFLCFSVLLKPTLKLGCIGPFVLPLLAGINFFPFSIKIEIIMQSNLLIKMYGLVTQEWNRPHASPWVQWYHMGALCGTETEHGCWNNCSRGLGDSDSSSQPAPNLSQAWHLISQLLNLWSKHSGRAGLRSCLQVWYSTKMPTS